MQVIFKYPLYSGENEIHVPADAVPLHVDAQGDSIYVWMMHESGANHTSTRQFTVYGTGWVFDDDDVMYVGTVITELGCVWHVFEKTRPF